MIRTFISVSVLIAAVLLARAVLWKRVSKVLIYSLWLIPVARMLLFHFAAIPRDISVIDNTIEKAAVRHPVAISKILNSITEFESGMFVYVWLMGFAFVLLGYTVTFFVFRCKLRKSRTLLQKSPICKLNIYASDIIDTPSLVGFCIYIPDGLQAEPRHLKYSVMHEETHFRHGDPLWNIVRVLMLALNWFNPLMWIAVRCSKNDSEYACDESVSANISEQDKQDYCRVILEIATGLTFERNSSLQSSICGGSLKRRIQAIVVAEKHMNLLGTLMAGVLMVVSLLSLTPQTDRARWTYQTYDSESQSTVIAYKKSQSVIDVQSTKLEEFDSEPKPTPYLVTEYNSFEDN